MSERTGRRRMGSGGARGGESVTVRRAYGRHGVALLLAATPVIAHAHGQQALFMPVGQLVALLPAAVIAWRFTSGIAARAVVIMAAPRWSRSWCGS